MCIRDRYFTDRGLEELAERRGGEAITLEWLAERLRDFLDLYPEFRGRGRTLRHLARAAGGRPVVRRSAQRGTTGRPQGFPSAGSRRTVEETTGAGAQCRRRAHSPRRGKETRNGWEEQRRTRDSQAQGGQEAEGHRLDRHRTAHDAASPGQPSEVASPGQARLLRRSASCRCAAVSAVH